MLHIPVLRQGRPYESVEKVEIRHHATGEPVALVSQANSGMVRRDILAMRDDVLERFSVRELMDLSRRAAELFVTASLPVGEAVQSFEEYVAALSATTGMPVSYCRANADKIRKVLDEIETVLRGLTRGLDWNILDRGHGRHGDGVLSFHRVGRIFGAVLPSNSPGVHSLWIPAIPLKSPIVLKPGREEPWTPLRIIEALAAAGVPREAMGFYPTDHAGAGELLRSVDRAMLFGAGPTVRPYAGDLRIELHGPGYSKILLGDDEADHWEKHVDVIVSSIEANAGRSCINASAVWTPKHARPLAEAVARRLAQRRALPADDPEATLAAFADARMPEQISASIDQGLRGGGAEDLAQRFRGRPRLVRDDGCTYLLPTVVHCAERDHPLANREFLFPYASVIECPTEEMPDAIGPSLIVTAISSDQRFIRGLMDSSNVDRLNVGPIPTWRISWDQPHEGNLFEHLYRQRAFQMATA